MPRARDPNVEPITPLQQAAILVMYLQPQAARRVLAQLDDEDVKRLARAMSELGEVDQGLVEEVVHAFLDQLADVSVVPSTGQDFAKRLLPDLLSPERKDRISVSVRLHNQADFEAFVRTKPARAIAAALADEHPQVRAVALLRMGPENAARVLACFSQEEQSDLTIRICSMERVSSEVADDVEAAIRAAVADIEEPMMLGGVERAARIMSRMAADKNSVVLAQVREHSESLAEDLVRRMVRFEDLEKLDARSIQTLLRSIESADLAVALRSAAPSLREKFLSNISQRAAADLTEELELGAPVRRALVREAQDRITATARRLADEGVIFLDSGEAGSI
jgi:flagellar motor switch protein FliG